MALQDSSFSTNKKYQYFKLHSEEPTLDRLIKHKPYRPHAVFMVGRDVIDAANAMESLIIPVSLTHCLIRDFAR